MILFFILDLALIFTAPPLSIPRQSETKLKDKIGNAIITGSKLSPAYGDDENEV
jgi:hypothetical protein